MVKTRKVGAAGRFGSRYGTHVKRKISDIESKQRKKQECPFCGARAKRLSKGIWSCNRCGKKFAGHSYYLEPGSVPVIKDKLSEPLKTKKNQEKIRLNQNGNL